MSIVRHAIDWLSSRSATALFSVAAILSLVTMIVLGYKTSKLQQCQADYAEANARVQIARSQAFQEDLAVIDKMVFAVAHATTREAYTKALAEYEATRKQNDRERDLNPLPEPPSAFC